jgi:drug/metabolite transporter (DMT)-like permease
LICASIGNVAQLHPVARSLPIASVLAWGMLWGALGNAVFGWLVFGPPVWDTHPGYTAGVLYLGVLASAFAFTLYFQVIREIGAARAAYSSVLIPIIALTLSTIFESYRWSAAAMFGASLTVVGLIIALRARSPSR